MRKLWVSMLTVLLLVFVAVPTALAVDTRTGTRLQVPADQIIHDDLMMSGGQITIDGTVDGDLYVIAESLTLNGKVNGNLFALVNVMDINGDVTGSVLVAGSDLVVGGRVTGSLVSAGQAMTLAPGGSVGRNWIGAGERLIHQGSVGRGMLVGASDLRIEGKTSMDVRAAVGTLQIGPKAVIGGPVRYTSKADAKIEPGAQTGEVVKTLPTSDWNHETGPWFTSLFLVALKFGGFLLIGFVFMAGLPALRTTFPALLIRKPWQAPLIGLLALIIVPVAAVLLLVTIVGIPLSILSVIMLPVGIYVGQIYVSWSVGQMLCQRVGALAKLSWPFVFVLGTAITTLAIEIPYVGVVLATVAVAYGLGGLCLLLAKRGEVA